MAIKIGDRVDVTASKFNEDFENDFTGIVVSFSGFGLFARDQDDNVWYCDMDQCELTEENQE